MLYLLLFLIFSAMPVYEQRTIERFFQDLGVTNPDMKAHLLPLLTHVIYGFNQHVIQFEKEQDEYRKKQIEREIIEIQEKIKQIVLTEQKGQSTSFEA